MIVKSKTFHLAAVAASLLVTAMAQAILSEEEAGSAKGDKLQEDFLRSQ